jgi:hypothetical protein
MKNHEGRIRYKTKPQEYKDLLGLVELDEGYYKAEQEFIDIVQWDFVVDLDIYKHYKSILEKLKEKINLNILL